MGESASAPIRESAWGEYVRRCALRDESALAALYDQSSQLVYTIALRILRDEADASEVVVDVYKQVWDTAARFDEQRGSAAAWIVMLTRSRAMDRRRYRATRIQATANFEELSEPISPLSGTPGDHWANQGLGYASFGGRAVRTARSSGVIVFCWIEPR